MNENSQTEGINNNYVSFSFAYQKGLNETGTQQIGIGFQTTLARRKLERPKNIFEDQLNQLLSAGYTNIDYSLFEGVDISYTDVNVGLIYQGEINSSNYLSAGISMQHITTPYKTFSGGELSVPREVLSHIAWERHTTSGKSIYVSALTNFSDKHFNSVLSGISYEMPLKKNYQMLLGGWLRKGIRQDNNSFTPSLGLKCKNFIINTSYDINISSKLASLSSASELSLIYINAVTRERFLENKFIKF